MRVGGGNIGCFIFLENVNEAGLGCRLVYHLDDQLNNVYSRRPRILCFVVWRFLNTWKKYVVTELVVEDFCSFSPK